MVTLDLRYDQDLRLCFAAKGAVGGRAACMSCGLACVHSHFVVTGAAGREKLCERCKLRGLLPEGLTFHDLTHVASGECGPGT